MGEGSLVRGGRQRAVNARLPVRARLQTCWKRYLQRSFATRRIGGAGSGRAGQDGGLSKVVLAVCRRSKSFFKFFLTRQRQACSIPSCAVELRKNTAGHGRSWKHDRGTLKTGYCRRTKKPISNPVKWAIPPTFDEKVRPESLDSKEASSSNS